MGEGGDDGAEGAGVIAGTDGALAFTGLEGVIAVEEAVGVGPDGMDVALQVGGGEKL